MGYTVLRRLKVSLTTGFKGKAKIVVWVYFHDCHQLADSPSHNLLQVKAGESMQSCLALESLHICMPFLLFSRLHASKQALTVKKLHMCTE